jgi:hypothetical protein
MKKIIHFGLLLITAHFVLGDSNKNPTSVGHNQQNAQFIYKKYINSLEPEKKFHLPNSPELLKSLMKGYYDGMKDGLKEATKIASAAFLSNALVKGAQYCLPSFLNPINIEVPQGYPPQSVDPKTTLFMSGFVYFLQSWMAKNKDSLNQMALKTMSQKDVLKVIPLSRIERHAHPIIHPSIDDLMKTLSYKLQTKQLDSLHEESGLYVFHGPSGTGKTEGVKSAAVLLYDSLPDEIKDQVLLAECSLKQANSGVINESGKNVEKLEKYYFNLLHTPNQGKQVRVLILLSNEVVLLDRETHLKNNEEAKKIIAAYLELIEKYPDLSKENQACLLHFVTTNDNPEDFDGAIDTRVEEYSHFDRLSSERKESIIKDSIQKSIDKRKIQLINKDQDEIFKILNNLRSFPKIEKKLWRAWGQGNIACIYSPIFYPIEFNHIVSCALKKDYNKPAAIRKTLEDNIKKIDHNKTDISFLLNHDSKQPINYKELADRIKKRHDQIISFKDADDTLFIETADPAYQAAVRAYKKELRLRDDTPHPIKKYYQEEADFEKELEKWEFSFEYFVKNEYTPVLPEYNIIKRNAIKLKHSLFGKKEFNLQELRNGIATQHQNIVNLHIDRGTQLINAYKIDYQSMQYIKINDSNNQLLPSVKLAPLNQKIADAAKGHTFDRSTHINPLQKINAPYKFANIPQPLERKFINVVNEAHLD